MANLLANLLANFRCFGCAGTKRWATGVERDDVGTWQLLSDGVCYWPCEAATAERKAEVNDIAVAIGDDFLLHWVTVHRVAKLNPDNPRL